MFTKQIKSLSLEDYRRKSMLYLPPYANTISCVVNCEKWLNKYNWRYDSVLNSLLQQFSKIVKTSSKIYCDSNKYQYNTTLQLFMTQCPDNAVLDGHEVTVIELIICFQTNTLKSREYKIKRYKYIKSQLLQPLSKFKVLFAEITSLVFISK